MFLSKNNGFPIENWRCRVTEIGMISKILILFLLVSFSPIISYAKTFQQPISGIVKDLEGKALDGVTIKIKGSNIVATTDQNGNFQIAAKDGEVLVISSIGFIEQEVYITQKVEYSIVLLNDTSEIDEVVVVGYGKQKKINLTGAVSTVSDDVLTKRPVLNLPSMLQGRVAGLQITQASGQAGKENTGMSIRGMGSYGASSAPMVLIDGVLGSMSNVDPNDVESVSVLKDAASAAIYGARAANGVILVTTKRGKSGKPVVSYSNHLSIQEATKLPELIWNSAETMELWNSAVSHTGSAYEIFTKEEIESYRNGNSNDFPSYNWVDNTFQKAFVHDHHFSLSGGTDKTNYLVSAGYANQEGILPGHDHQRYSTTLTLNSEIRDWISLGSNVSLMQRNFTEPWLANEDYVLLIYSQTGLAMPYLPDGSGRYAARAYEKVWQNRNPVAVASEGGRKRNDYNVRAQGNIDIKPLPGLTWSTKFAVNLDLGFDKVRAYGVDNFYYQKKNPTDEDFTFAHNLWPTIDNGIIQDNYKTSLYTLFSTLTYEKKIDLHDFVLLGGYSQESQKFDQLGGGRIGIPSKILNEINAGSPVGQSVRGTANEWAIQSLFGRINYNYDERFLFEANLRYDGTSRIYKDNRWGLFPSLSAGWRISEEKFMDKYDWLDDLKLRLSYGKLGNQEIGNYPYQDILNQANYSFGSSISSGAYVTRLTDKRLRWETTEVFNAGLDYSMLQSLFGFSLDVYKKTTKDILYTQPIPASVGLAAPTVNFGSMENTGFDLELWHRKSFDEFNYRISGVFSTYKNNVIKLLSPSIGSNTISKEGEPWGSYYMYEWIGIFQSAEDVANSPKQPYNPKPGDLKFKDQDGNGTIGPEDRIIMDGAHPKFVYSANLDMEYKQFDFSIFFQGVQGRKVYVKEFGIEPFYQGGAPPVAWRNSWSPSNPTNKMPHIYVAGNGEYSPINGNASSYFLQDASYLRLKSAQLGYTFNKSILDRISLSGLRVFVAADNLFTITKYTGADPEGPGNGRYAQYPQVRVFSAGINVKL